MAKSIVIFITWKVYVGDILSKSVFSKDIMKNFENFMLKVYFKDTFSKNLNLS